MVDVMDASTSDWAKLSSDTIASNRGSFVTINASLSAEYNSLLGLTITDSGTIKTDIDKKRSIDQEIGQTKTDIAYQKNQISLTQKEIDQSKESNDQQLANDTLDYNIKIDPLTSDEKTLAKLQLDAARIAVQEQEVSLSKTQLKSPVDGVVLSLT